MTELKVETSNSMSNGKFKETPSMVLKPTAALMAIVSD